MSDYLREYTAAIRSGQIVAGAELISLLDRLEADRDRYAYDTTDAKRRIAFMEGCVKLTKAPYYGRPMVLLLWQKAWIEALFSFKMADASDRFKKTLLLCARKNAKTETSSGLAFDELICGEAGADICCASNDDGQTAILYDSIDTMRLMVDPQGWDTHRNQSWIKNKINDSKVFKLSQRTVNKEGRGIDFAAIDEVHEMKDNSVIKAIEQSMSLKTNPKLILITTEGFTNEGYLDNELIYARKILAGEIDDEASERYLPWLYTQDSENEVFQDERTWQKSNPSLDIIKPRSYLKEQLALARESKPDRVFVLCKDFNIKQNNSAAWLNADEYTNEATFALDDFKGAFCLGGVDLSETTDLSCAKIMMMRPDENIKYIHTAYFIPESKLSKSPDDAAGAQYAKWAQEGWLTIVPGNDIDLTAVADWFLSLYNQYDIRPFIVGYDQRFAKQFLKRMDDYGIQCEMINQNAETMGNAVKLVEADLHGRLLNYQNNPVDRWCLGNAAIRVDNRGQALIVKPQNRASYRIDGAVCFAILAEVYRRYRSDFQTMIA
jgi:phage terminase large subunit-like protein